jgi:hypothetical protein
LAAAHVADGNDKCALPILQKVEKLCRQNGWNLFLSNCLEISSQIAIRAQRWGQAEELLKEAELQGKSAHKYLLFVEKWRAISKLSQNPYSTEARTELEEVRKKALQVRDWETIRDLDFQIGLHCNERNLLEKLYFGTPYRQYRKKIEKIFKLRKWELPNLYNWPDHRSNYKKFFDPFDGTNNGVEVIKTGKTVHRLIILLSTDLYRPFAMAQIFSKIFVGEYFNPTSSPDRVYQAIQKARKLFNDNGVDIDIEVDSGLCSLKCHPLQSLVLRKKLIVNKTRNELVQVSFLQKIKLAFQHKSFSASQVATQLEVSPGTARSLLASAEKTGSIIKFGNGRSTLYRLP